MRVNNEEANHVTIEGGTGSGKSHFTLVLMFVISYMNKNVFDLKKQMLFIPDEKELEESLRALPEGGVLCLDEALRALHKHNWYAKEQQALNMFAKTERYRLSTILYNVQSFSELTNTFRNSNIQIRIIIIRKYGYVVRIKDDDPDMPDPWHIALNIKRKYGATLLKYDSLLTPEERLKKERKCAGVQFYGLYPNFKSVADGELFWEYYRYERDKSRTTVKEKAKEKEEKKKEDNVTKSERRYRKDYLKAVAYVQKQTGMPLREALKVLDCSYSVQMIKNARSDNSK